MNCDLENKPIQSILQCMSSLFILLKVACNRIPTGNLFLTQCKLLEFLRDFNDFNFHSGLDL